MNVCCRLCAVSLLLLWSASLASAQQAKQTKSEPKSPTEVIQLFNGKDLTGWKNPFEWGKAEVVEGRR